jgi:tetratricopeptide (TPR) repeat protein
MIMKKYILKTLLLLTVVTQQACAPDFLDVKPDKALVVPSQLNHFQALLDAATVAMNQGPGLQILATDEFYHTESAVANLNFIERNSYLWADQIYEGRGVRDWEYPYKAIFNANIALDGLSRIKPDAASQREWDHIYASALFYRAFSFYNLAEVFAAPYREQTAGSLPGIPLRLSMDVNELVGRGTLKQTYEQILKDLTEAGRLLSPEMTHAHRPSGAAVKAALARIYLGMQQYEKAGQMASEALQIQSTLMDFNTLDTVVVLPFPRPLSLGNPEIIFHYGMTPYVLANSPLTHVDSAVYNAYEDNDLRKKHFIIRRPNNVMGYKGSYGVGADGYGGLVTDELYLIRAECHARSGRVEQALSDVNTLLKARYKTGTFKELTATADNILELVLRERRKELLGRGHRWSDLRRLNQDPRFAVTLKRVVNGVEYTLPPNDDRYVFPIPDDEIAISGIEQNPR